MTFDNDQGWPDLAIPTLKSTCETLQLWLQIVGKLRLALTPWLNHSWHVVFQLSARGFATPLLPHPQGSLDVEFDFPAQVMLIRVAEGEKREIALAPMSTASFYGKVMTALEELKRPVSIDLTPNEMPMAKPFPQDDAPRLYDPEAALALWRAMVRMEVVLQRFRTGFIGKCSPVHLFWGGFDLAVTRFSGRRAPLHSGGIPNLPDVVTQEAYSHEVASAGFWPGGNDANEPSFYAYAYPTPTGFAEAPVSPAQAYFSTQLGEFLLSYAAVRAAKDPEAALMSFLETTYAAAANLGAWDRSALECKEGRPGVCRLVT